MDEMRYLKWNIEGKVDDSEGTVTVDWGGCEFNRECTRTVWPACKGNGSGWVCGWVEWRLTAAFVDVGASEDEGVWQYWMSSWTVYVIQVQISNYSQVPSQPTKYSLSPAIRKKMLHFTTLPSINETSSFFDPYQVALHQDPENNTAKKKNIDSRMCRTQILKSSIPPYWPSKTLCSPLYGALQQEKHFRTGNLPLSPDSHAQCPRLQGNQIIWPIHQIHGWGNKISGKICN